MTIRVTAAAEVYEKHYSSSGTPFYVVICARCCSALNSGHHYSARDRHHAETLADEHNRRHH